MSELIYKAISIRQPWADLIINCAEFAEDILTHDEGNII